jgi:antitoxin component YwqK of YwqJK toxin-antitoxin module
VKISVFLLALLCAAALGQAQESYGTIRATTKVHPDGTKSTTVVDPEKRTAEETVFDAGGKVRQKVTYLLGDGDLALGAIFYDPKGNVKYKASYKRDGQNRVIETSFTSPSEQYLGKRKFIYGSSDVARVEDYDANGALITRPQAASRAAVTPRKK